MRLVRDVFTSFPAFPVAARSTVPALLFHFPAGRVNNEICPVPLFSGLHKQLILAVVLFFETCPFRRSHQGCAGCRRFRGWTGSLD
ncbi:MAG TPA: hypothetical protein ENJ32_14440 [Crenotrichaceae bacterium]|nr:hypothetical protein [Crenotrichaceae bacterium]